MIDLPYSLIIGATEDPEYFGFFSPDLEGFTGIGHSMTQSTGQAAAFSGEIKYLGMKTATVGYRSSKPKTLTVDLFMDYIQS